MGSFAKLNPLFKIMKKPVGLRYRHRDIACVQSVCRTLIHRTLRKHAIHHALLKILSTENLRKQLL